MTAAMDAEFQRLKALEIRPDPSTPMPDTRRPAMTDTSAEAIEKHIRRINWLYSEPADGGYGGDALPMTLAENQTIMRALLAERDAARAEVTDVLAENDALRFDRNNLRAEAQRLREARGE